LKKDDFVSTIGYSGDTAIVDKNLQRPDTPIKVLLEKGLYKAAFSRALYEKDIQAQEAVLKEYNRISNSHYKSVEELKRLFGVFQVQEKITRVKRI